MGAQGAPRRRGRKGFYSSGKCVGFERQRGGRWRERDDSDLVPGPSTARFRRPVRGELNAIASIEVVKTIGGLVAEKTAGPAVTTF